MKKNLNLFIAGYLIFLLLSVFSCSDCSGGGGRYSVTSFDVQNKKVVFDNETYSTLDIDANSVSYNEYAILIEPMMQSVAAKRAFLTTTAYACSPADPIYEDKFLDLQITSTSDYNTNFTAGTNLTSLFDVIFYEEYVSSQQRMDLETYLNTNPVISLETMLVLKTPPTNTNQFSFTVNMDIQGDDLSDFEFTTETIEITL